MRLSLLAQDPKETRKISKLLARDLLGGEVFGLIGDLGSGKTTFIAGAAQGLGIRQKIKSPTFVILKKYKTPRRKRIKYFCHLDLYRLPRITRKNMKILGFDLREIIKKDSVVFIEWAEKIASLLPEGWIKIKFKYISENKRGITISSQ